MPRKVSRTKTGFVQEILGKGDLTIDAWGKPKFSQDYSILHGMWTFDIPRTWMVFENNVEMYDSYSKAYSENGALVLTSSGTDNCIVKSKSHPRYQPNRGILYSTSIGLPTPEANGIREWGLSTISNGVFFRLRDGKLYAVRFDAGVDYEEEITIPFDVDLSKGNIYDIQLQWRGVGNILFFMGNPETGTSQIVHEMKLLGTIDGLSLNNPALPIHFKTQSTGEDLSMWSGCVDLSVEGGVQKTEQYESIIGEEVICSATGNSVLLLRITDLINGNKNTRDSHPYQVNIYSEKKSRMNLYFFRDPTAVVGGTWSPYNSLGYFEVNNTLTSYDTDKMHLISSRPLESGKVAEVKIPNPNVINFTMIHSDYLLIEGIANVGTIEASIEFGIEI